MSSNHMTPHDEADQARITELEHLLIAILHADARGQWLPFQEAMNHAHRALTPSTTKEVRS